MLQLEVCTLGPLSAVSPTPQPPSLAITHLYSAIQKKGIPSSPTTWVGPEGIILSEINRTETHKYYNPTMCNLRMPNSEKQRRDGWLSNTFKTKSLNRQYLFIHSLT